MRLVGRDGIISGLFVGLLDDCMEEERFSADLSVLDGEKRGTTLNSDVRFQSNSRLLAGW